jgi:hypothetical protein
MEISMLVRIFLGIRRIWIAVTLATALMSLVMLCRAEPEAKTYGTLLLLADLAQGWLFFHEKAMQWLLRTWKTKDNWRKRTVFDTLRAIGGMTFMAVLVAVGAFILFAETCLPPLQPSLK